MKKATCGLLIALGLVIGLVMGNVRSGRAQSSVSFPSTVEVYSYPSGNTGFFYPEQGVIYVYDGNLVNCVGKRQVVKWGSPMLKIP